MLCLYFNSWNSFFTDQGPGKYRLGKDERYMINHAFDGMPFMHRFELSSARQSVRYNSRHLCEAVERDIVSGAQMPDVFFGHVPDTQGWSKWKNLLARFKLVVPLRKVAFGDPGSSMVGVTATPNYPIPTRWNAVQMKEKDAHFLVSKTDANILQQVQSDSLEPTRLFDYSAYDPRIEGDLSAAHHQYDPVTQEIFNFALKVGPITKLTVFSISESGHVTILAEITHRKLPDGECSGPPSRIGPSYIHSFHLTKNYVIIPEFPLQFDPLELLVTGNAVAGMVWRKDMPTYFHIVSRQPNVGHIASLPTDPIFSFHNANAWDSTDASGNPVIELDTCTYPNGDIIYQVHSFGALSPPSWEESRVPQTQPKGITVPPTPQSSFGDLRRYRLTLRNVTYRTLAKNIEFPRFSMRKSLMPYNYLWACQLVKSIEGKVRFALVKVDLTSGQMVVHDNDPAKTFSEPIFVPKHDADDEDEGALVALVNEEDKGCSLVILDAKSMEPLGHCSLGNFHISTFHGSFVDEQFRNVSVN
ncbi:carotenoid oxygenase [Dichotomocladium elegans]|nr:carotenoid oxygenase [Dichotomocladium elegans]